MLKTKIPIGIEDSRDKTGKKIDNSHYFDNKKIMDAGEDYTCHMGKYPVIKLSLKSAKQPDFDTVYACLVGEIAKEYRRHECIVGSDVLTENEKKIYTAIMNGEAEYQNYATAFKNLSEYLERYHGKQAIVLIDEYDVVLENAWFDKKIRKTDMIPLVKAIENGDCATFAKFLSAQLMDTISFFDYKEDYYHGFLAGILKSFGNYEVLSNCETGEGRSDLVMKENAFMGRGIILELKVAKKFGEMGKKCEEALKQIETLQYEYELREEGYQEILKYGVCFFKKGCMVKKAGH